REALVPELAPRAVGDLPRDRRGEGVESPPDLGDRALPVEQLDIAQCAHGRGCERHRHVADGGEAGGDRGHAAMLPSFETMFQPSRASRGQVAYPGEWGGGEPGRARASDYSAAGASSPAEAAAA